MSCPSARCSSSSSIWKILLILLARRCRRTKRPVARVRRERRQNALVEDARAYFGRNLAHELKIDDICTALGCTRPQLQQAFRARLHRTAMEEFSAMRIEYAAQLLARGASPGEVAAQMGYCSGAYFSQKFRAATGHTPSAYRRIQQGLPARRQNRQQKGKSESKSSYCRNSAERVEYKQREASRSVRTQQYHIT